MKTPKKDVNSCEDFIIIVTSALLVTAAMATFQLKSPHDYPTNQLVPWPGADTIWTLSDFDREKCLRDMCGQVFDKFINFKFTQTTKSGKDHIFNYSVQLLRLGCFYLEFRDAIKEGDGERVLRCWKYMIPIFSASGNTNYACEAVNLVLQHSYTGHSISIQRKLKRDLFRIARNLVYVWGMVR